MCAFFSNATEAMFYEERYCAKCLHYGGERCPVLLAHWVCASYAGAKFHDDGSPERMVLDLFIPRDKDGVNQQCEMFMMMPDEGEKEQRRRDLFYACTGERLSENVYAKVRAKRQIAKNTLVSHDDVEVLQEPVEPVVEPCDKIRQCP